MHAHVAYKPFDNITISGVGRRASRRPTPSVRTPGVPQGSPRHPTSAALPAAKVVASSRDTIERSPPPRTHTANRPVCAGGGSGARQTYTYETLVQYADSPLSKLPPAGLAAFPPELARKVTLAGPRRAPPRRPAPPLPPPCGPAPAPARLLAPFRVWPPLHHPNYLAALLCRNFY